MKRIFFGLLLSVFFSSALQAQNQTPPPPGPAPSIQIGQAESFQLKNGLKVFVVENHKLPVVSLSLVLDNDPIVQGDKNGYVDIAGTMLRTGTKTRSKEKLDEEIDYIGASLAPSANGLAASSLKKHLNKLMELASDVVLNPNFKQEELDKIKKQTLSGLADSKANPNIIQGLVRSSLLYGKDHPFGEVPSEQSINNITLADVQGYYNTYYKPNVGYLAIVGDISVKEAKSLVKKYFGSWKKGEIKRSTLPTPTPAAGTRVAIVDRPAAVQSVISVANTANLKPGSEDAVTSRVLNNLLGGSFSRLTQNLREKHGYTYGAYSDLSPSKYIGEFSASTNVRNAVTDSAVQEILFELNRLRTEKASAEEVQKTKNIVTGEFARSLEVPNTVALFAINTARYNLPKDYYRDYLKKVAAVTPEAIQQVAQKYITPDQTVILVVGNADQIEDRIKRFDKDGTLEYYSPLGEKAERTTLALPAGATADKVLDAYVQALGGRANLDKVKDMTIKSTITSTGANLTYTQYFKGPDKMVQIIKVGDLEIQRTIINGNKGKVISQNSTKVMSPEEVQEQKIQYGLNNFLRYNALGVKKNLSTLERINGRRAYRLELSLPSGQHLLQYYDLETGLKMREIVVTATDLGNATQVTEVTDYRDVNGIKFPYLTQLHAGNQLISTTVQSVEVNKNLKDDLFKL
ncbi:M16 family metallopeptidase [Adhaeribacter radiodurans]|uniref:Insulinase family protein n=1 Tax=Adhaeribacter radiodurans TaxID=2745197 RepID=A0A7L7LED2_9BACT|nr:pitrilysin family protein [Adhaeribacter radiodurans]QMU30769.1 insulinase family protein [Adhaeribacter radiodurans]